MREHNFRRLFISPSEGGSAGSPGGSGAVSSPAPATSPGGSPAGEGSAAPAAAPASSPAPSAAPAPNPLSTFFNQLNSGQVPGQQTAPAPPSVQPQTPQPPSGFSVPETDDDLAAIPPQFRELVAQHRGVYRQTSQELQAAKQSLEGWKPLESYGQPETIQSRLSIIDGLRTPITDQNGQIQYDQATGMPLFTARPGLEQLASQSPMQVAQIFDDLCEMEFVPGLTYQQALLQQLGLDPNRIDEYKRLQPGQAPEPVTALELQGVPPEFHEAFKALSPAVRRDWDRFDPDQQEELLKQSRDGLETRQRLDQIEARERQMAQQQLQRFDTELRQMQQQAIGNIRNEEFDQIRQSLAKQWQPSADPATNEAHYGLVMSMLGAVIDPDLRAVAMPALKALNVDLSPDFDRHIATIEAASRQVEQLQAYANSPLHQNLRDQIGLEKAQRELNAARLSARAVLANVALKISQLLGGQVKAAAQQTDQSLQQRGRPSINGTPDAVSASGRSGFGRPGDLSEYGRL